MAEYFSEPPSLEAEATLGIEYDNMLLLDINRTIIQVNTENTLESVLTGGNDSKINEEMIREAMCELWKRSNYSSVDISLTMADCGWGDQFILPWYMQMFFYILFSTMVIVAAGGNLIVIYIVLADRKMRSITNIFLVNLSIADAMNATFNVVFNFTYMLNKLNWRFGHMYCKICAFVSVLSISASVLTLMAISFDR